MWKKKRNWVLKKADYRCERCGADNKQLYVNHKTYERVGYEEQENLIAVCKSCHGKLHGENPKLDIVSLFRLHED
jgi:5-methylcytosine-specific restriction endonuclease McrA